MADIIPAAYSSGHEYEEFLPYFSTKTSIKALIMAKDINSLHIDIEINFGISISFNILNTYAGYKGYSLVDVLSVNKTE